MPDVDLAIRRAAQRRGVSPQVLKKLVRQESGGNNKAKSPAGARGIAQFMPATAKQYGVNLDDNRISDDLDGAARYLADSLKRTGGNYTEALSIYNSGRPDGYKHIAETANYVKSILNGVDTKASPATKAPKSASSVDRRSAILAYAQNTHAPGALQSLAAGLATPSEPKAATPEPDDGGTSKGGVANFDGKPVAAWIKPLLEYARERGWKGSVTSGYRSDADQTRIYRSGVRPAAKPKALGGGGSKHSETGFLKGAIDVTDARTLDKILKAKNSRLKAAGAKDPPHFSVSRNGTY